MNKLSIIGTIGVANLHNKEACKLNVSPGRTSWTGHDAPASSPRPGPLRERTL